jgi:hypothetical protein
MMASTTDTGTSLGVATTAADPGNLVFDLFGRVKSICRFTLNNIKYKPGIFREFLYHVFKKKKP